MDDENIAHILMQIGQIAARVEERIANIEAAVLRLDSFVLEVSPEEAVEEIDELEQQIQSV